MFPQLASILQYTLTAEDWEEFDDSFIHAVVSRWKQGSASYKALHDSAG